MCVLGRPIVFGVFDSPKKKLHHFQLDFKKMEIVESFFPQYDFFFLSGFSYQREKKNTHQITQESHIYTTQTVLWNG